MTDHKLTLNDWERLRIEIPAVEPSKGPIDESLMKVYIDMAEIETDAINPDHYKSGDIECIDAIKESMSNIAYKGYLKGNCMKYLWRYETKHLDNPQQDLEKAQWYLDKLLEVVRSK